MLHSYKLSKLARGLIYFTLFIPFFIIPYTLWPLVFARNLIFYCVVGAALFLAFLYLCKNKFNYDFKINYIFGALAAFAGIALIGSFLSSDPANSFFGFEPRMGGSLAYVALLGWFTALLLFFNDQEGWLRLFKISSSVAFAVSLLAMVQAFLPPDIFLGGKPEGVKFLYHRLDGILGNPIFLAGYVLPHIFLSLCLFLKTDNRKQKFFWLGLALFFVVVMSLTQTKGALVGFVCAALFIGLGAVFYLLKNRKQIYSKLAVITLPPLIFGGLIFLNPALLGRFRDISLSSPTAITRLMLWQIAIRAFFDKWFLGWGLENFKYAFSKFYNPLFLKYSFYETWSDKPHNQFLEIAATTGIFGFLSYLLIFLGALFSLVLLIKKDKGNFFYYITLSGAVISCFVHISFAFDTLESRLVIFMIMGYIVFLATHILGRGHKIAFNSIRGLVSALLIVMLTALNFIGIATVSAAYHTSRANDFLIVSKYNESKQHLVSLEKIKTPYDDDNWEYLADSFLKTDALGRLPSVIAKDVLPILIRGLEKAASDHPDNFSYSYRLGQMYNLAGIHINGDYFDKAVGALENAKKISPKRQVADLLLAQIFYYQRDTQKAIDLLKNLISGNPDTTEPYWFLGILYEANGDSKQAYAFMSTAVEKGYPLKNINEEALYVGVLGKLKDYKAMAPIFERMIAKNKENAGLWANAAVVYLELKQYDKARDAARQAIFLDPAYGDEGEKFIKKVDAAE